MNPVWSNPREVRAIQRIRKANYPDQRQHWTVNPPANIQQQQDEQQPREEDGGYTRVARSERLRR